MIDLLEASASIDVVKSPEPIQELLKPIDAGDYRFVSDYSYESQDSPNQDG